MTLVLLSGSENIPSEEWSRFVCGHPQGSVFQSPEMFEFFRVVPGFHPIVLGVKDDAGELQGILLAAIIREMNGPLSFFSSRTVIYGGPLVNHLSEQKEKILEMLLDGLINAVRRRSIFIQFRNFFSQENHQDVFENQGFHLRDRLNLIVDTSDRETMIRNMSASRWRQIRKGLGIKSAVGSRQSAVSSQQSAVGGQRSAVGIPEPGTRNPESYARIITPTNISQVRQFYDILYALYRYKVKKPLPPWEFFEQFYYFSRQGKLGVILLIEYKEQIIGGILAPVTPGKTIYEWYVCGRDLEYREVHPSVLATWAALEYAVENNIPEFDFMGVGIPDREYGVREFKSRFGGRMVNYGRYARVNNRMLYGIAEAGYNILSILKKI